VHRRDLLCRRNIEPRFEWQLELRQFEQLDHVLLWRS
jgi:hypothetical protein